MNREQAVGMIAIIAAVIFALSLGYYFATITTPTDPQASSTPKYADITMVQTGDYKARAGQPDA